VNGFERFHLDQGSLGNCWFISALYSIAQIPKLFSQVVPPDNVNNYNGTQNKKIFLLIIYLYTLLFFKEYFISGKST
jgi:hypothetical protein